MDDVAAAPRKLTTSDIREANVGTVYRLLREHNALTRAELVRTSGLARPTVMAIVRDLLADGLIDETGEVRAPAVTGRPGSLLRFRSDARVIAAVRMREGQLEAALVDLSGDVIVSGSQPRAPTATTWTAFLESVADQVRDLHVSVRGGPLAALAVSLPGSIDRSSGLWSLPRAPRWRDVPVSEFLGQALGVPVGPVNVVAAALLGQIARQPEYARSAALVYVGRGVGAASVVNGRLIEGDTGGAGELGHCAVPGLTTKCPCGRRGCVETITAAPYLRREYRRLTGRQAPATLAEMELTGDAAVRRMLDTAAHDLGVAASWLVNIVNPAVLFVGGSPFMADAHRFRETFADTVYGSAHRPNMRSLRVLPAADTALAGTIQVAFELLPEALRPSLRLVR